MDSSKLLALAAELAKKYYNRGGIKRFPRELLKLTVETALSAELTDHLG